MYENTLSKVSLSNLYDQKYSQYMLTIIFRILNTGQI